MIPDAGLFRKAIDVSSCVLPWPKQRQLVFLSLRPGAGGAGTFARKIRRAFSALQISSTHSRLRSAEAALIFGQSRGEWFHTLCRRWGVRTVLRVDGFMIPKYFDNRTQPAGFQDRRLKLGDMAANYRLQRDLLLSDFVVYQSAFAKQMADAYLYHRRDRFALIYNGIDLDQFRPRHEQKRAMRLLSLGMLRHEYMLGTILPMLEDLVTRHPIELWVVGEMDSICREQLRAYREARPAAAAKITVLGPVDNDDLPEVIGRTDVLVHPRLGDWCPNAVIECLACGVPVVCGSWGGTAELVGDAGVVVPSCEWEYGDRFAQALSQAVERVIADLDTFKTRARSRAEELFDIRTVARRYAEAMEMCRSGHGA